MMMITSVVVLGSTCNKERRGTVGSSFNDNNNQCCCIRFDLQQGAAGNCWVISGASALAERPASLTKVLPPGQTVNNQDVNYCGTTSERDEFDRKCVCLAIAMHVYVVQYSGVHA